MTPIDLRMINALDYINEAETMLAAEHQAETESHLSQYKPHLNRNMYKALADDDLLFCVGAFVDNRMIGYCLAYTCLHQHYDIIVGIHDALYVSPKYRKGRLALRMMKMVEQEAAKKGAKMFFWTAKPDSQFDRILKLKCELEEFVYRKDL